MGARWCASTLALPGGSGGLTRPATAAHDEQVIGDPAVDVEVRFVAQLAARAADVEDAVALPSVGVEARTDGHVRAGHLAPHRRDELAVTRVAAAAQVKQAMCERGHEA